MQGCMHVISLLLAAALLFGLLVLTGCAVVGNGDEKVSQTESVSVTETESETESETETVTETETETQTHSWWPPTMWTNRRWA